MAPIIPIELAGQRTLKKLTQKGTAQMVGKKRKTSKGYLPGFVPDYCNAVETMAESEGFGSSVRLDAEMTASEDSSAPKTKCISLNVDTYDTFGVPFQVLSLSNMSKSERKDLGRKLKCELEQIRGLQENICSRSSNSTFLPPSIDISSYGGGQKKLAAEGSAQQGKKWAPPGSFGPCTKGTTTNAMLMKQCENLLKRLMSHQHAWVFDTPVDVVKLNIPDYFTIIKHPMDLGTVKQKLISGKYESPLGFASDVRLTFSNAMIYNPPGNDAHIMAEILSKFFEARWKPIEKKFSVILDQPVPSKSSVIEAETFNQTYCSKKKKIIQPDDKVKQEPVKRVMIDVDKHKLGTELEALLAELPEGIIDFLKENSSNASQVGEDEIEIDIDALSDDTLFTLRELLDDYLLDKQKNLAKAEPCEIELHHESGLSNSPVQQCKGDDVVDKDVDIGGNDMPVSNFPSVEIEKVATRRNSIYGSSNSSSSKSGSPSSDSHSGSSSGNETEGAKVSISLTGTKLSLDASQSPCPLMEAVVSEECLEQKKSDLVDPDIENDMLNGMSQVEQEHNSQSSPTYYVSLGANEHQEGESAPSEKPVSPQKLYRAALLRSRFADTILKAQEKTLEGEKQNPEKLRLEKEELERRIREEKARLQAEAKAAEEARKRAEEEAAAEAKKNRELEREAARQALLKMEKTVDINENSQFMEDLEMFRTVDSDQLKSFTKDTSPDHSQNDFGSFKFQASCNPLEKLGLYMKLDDEEDEESAPQSVQDA